MSSHRIWLVLSIATVSMVLGIAATAVLYASAVSNRTGADSITPGTWGPMPAGPATMGPNMMGHYPTAGLTCAAPALPGTVVDVTLTDMGAMMGPGMMGSVWNGYGWPRMHMMRIVADPATVPAGRVSLRAFNAGRLNHEVVVLPLQQGQFPGQRFIGSDGTVDEVGSLGEASRTCGPDEGDGDSTGDGIAPGATGWTTVNLPPGRYELICNIRGHYGAGMYSELDVTGPAG